MREDIKNRLTCAARQFRHNSDNSPHVFNPRDGFVIAYDREEVDELVGDLLGELEAARAQQSGEGREAWREVVQRAVDELSIMDESEGIAGFHLNGDVSPWSEGELPAVRDELQALLSNIPPADKPEREWVKPEDQLPELTGWYCVALADPDDIGWSTSVSWVAFWNGDDFEECDPIEDGQPVTHWMPLPKPPAAPDMGGEK